MGSLKEIEQLKACAPEMEQATELSHYCRNLRNDLGVQLCQAMRHAHTHGLLRKVKLLDLAGNSLGDECVRSLVALLDAGGLASVQKLYLDNNAISEQGMRELADAMT